MLCSHPCILSNLARAHALTFIHENKETRIESEEHHKYMKSHTYEEDVEDGPHDEKDDVGGVVSHFVEVVLCTSRHFAAAI